MTKTKTAAEELTNREEATPVFEEGFTPVSHVTVVKKNQRYVGVASKKIQPNEIMRLPHIKHMNRTREHDSSQDSFLSCHAHVKHVRLWALRLSFLQVI